jgi:hypothetical protein
LGAIIGYYYGSDPVKIALTNCRNYNRTPFVFNFVPAGSNFFKPTGDNSFYLNATSDVASAVYTGKLLTPINVLVACGEANGTNTQQTIYIVNCFDYKVS